MDTPPSDLGRRLSLVTVLESQLADIDRAEDAWAAYVEALRGIVRFIGRNESDFLPEDKAFWNLVGDLDSLRSHAKETLFAVNPNLPWLADFRPLLEADLRLRPLRLFDAINQPSAAERARATMAYLEARAVECEEVIARCRHDVGSDLQPAKVRAEEAARDSVMHGASSAEWRSRAGMNPVTRLLLRLFGKRR